ncbi:hypothetical protein AAG906_038130 [Vitis piasezkii]|uniref:Uncharacterized protein n=1 Tax=Vitis vinifera TaxID=29760 RepID=A0A438KGD4_VITVI|nr:hypothetical protein CK203_068475 [Vitis vinifera]RVX20254.1 hypothetical protein CK203_004900 [Vitis vinifera]
MIGGSSSTIYENSALVATEAAKVAANATANAGGQGISKKAGARTSKSLSALSVHSENFTLWIINSGAFDHMRSLSNLFSTYSPCPDLCSGKTIGSAKEIDELYYLVEDPIKSR